jgi:predicted RNA binding protein YcfA (HicA-like mRNA interferase family)
VTAKQIEKLIKINGWYFVRQKGSHRIYKHKSIPGIVVIPFHGKKDLPKGTEQSIFKKAEIK